MIGIPVGIAYSHFAEALFHRYVMHGFGRDPRSLWGHHWNEHHRVARRNGGRDDYYRTRSLFGWHAQQKERLTIAAALIAHLPLFPIAPLFVGTLAYCSYSFYQRHKRFHLDPEWGREHMPWHYDHHMGPDQDKNVGIAYPWYDYLAGTREPYARSAREAADRERRGRSVAANAGRAPVQKEPVSKEPEAVVRRMLDAANAGDWEAFAATWTPDAAWETPLATLRGKEAICRAWQPLFDIPGAFFAETKRCSAAGDTVENDRVDHFDLYGLRLDVDVTSVFVVRDGLLAEHRETIHLTETALATLRRAIAAPLASSCLLPGERLPPSAKIP